MLFMLLKEFLLSSPPIYSGSHYWASSSIIFIYNFCWKLSRFILSNISKNPYFLPWTNSWWRRQVQLVLCLMLNHQNEIQTIFSFQRCLLYHWLRMISFFFLQTSPFMIYEVYWRTFEHVIWLVSHFWSEQLLQPSSSSFQNGEYLNKPMH